MTIPNTASGFAAALAAFIGLLLALLPGFALELARVPPAAHLRPS